MAIYSIHYTETVGYDFEVEANSPEEAEDLFNQKVEEGEFDFNDGYVSDSDIKITEEK